MASLKTEQETSADVFVDKDCLQDVMWDFSPERPTHETQLVLPVCYGRGLRLKDIDPPPVPKCCLHLLEKPYEAEENNDLIQEERESPAGWTVVPPHVVQVDGLPLDADQDLLEDIIATHGTVQKSESRVRNGQKSMRFQLHNAEACNDLVLNLDGTNIFGSEASVKCYHL